MSVCDDCGLPISVRSNEGEMEERCNPCTRLVEDHPSVRVSPLDPGDLELVLAWRSNPEVYAHFRQQDGPLDWDEHVSWYESRDSDRYDFVINFDGRRVGVVNVDPTDEVGIFLGDFSARGNGVATTALGWLCDRFESRVPLFADIHEENEPSRELFERCGFQQQGCDGTWLRYVYDP